MSYKLIGISGKAGAGKDTLADLILNNGHGILTDGSIDEQTITKYALASPIKATIQDMFELGSEYFEDRELKETPIDWLGVSPRHMAQTLGTEWGRELVHPDVWLIAMDRWANHNLEPDDVLVVSDIRFYNEAKWIKDHGGVIVEVQRDSDHSIDSSHPSEKGILPERPDCTIFNDSTIDELYWRFSYAWHSFLGDLMQRRMRGE